MWRSCLAVVILVAALGCGIGRSGLHKGPVGADASAQSPDIRSDVQPPGPDTVAFAEVEPPVSDGPTTPISPGPDVTPPADLPPERPVPVSPDGPQLLRDTRPPFMPDSGTPVGPDLLPPLLPDGSPPIAPDVAPPLFPDASSSGGTDVAPPTIPDALPDGRRRRPDASPPVQECVEGGVCTSDCSATCGVVGVMSCQCMDGVLSCGDCEMLPITISPDPCPDNPTGKACSPEGLACIAFSGGTVSGACLCQASSRDASLRWVCLLR